MSKKGVFGTAILAGLVFTVIALVADHYLVRLFRDASKYPGMVALVLSCYIFVFSIMPLAALLDCRGLIRTQAFVKSLMKGLTVALVATPVFYLFARWDTEWMSLFYGEKIQVGTSWFGILFAFVLVWSGTLSCVFNPKKQAMKTGAA